MSETVGMGLTEFLLARLAEDEAVASAPSTFPGPSHELWICDEYGHVAADPARVLAEVASKRAIVAEHGERHGYDCGVCGVLDGICNTLRLLAAPYADHEDYRAEWAV